MTNPFAADRRKTNDLDLMLAVVRSLSGVAYIFALSIGGGLLLAVWRILNGGGDAASSVLNALVPAATGGLMGSTGAVGAILVQRTLQNRASGGHEPPPPTAVEIGEAVVAASEESPVVTTEEPGAKGGE